MRRVAVGAVVVIVLMMSAFIARSGGVGGNDHGDGSRARLNASTVQTISSRVTTTTSVASTTTATVFTPATVMTRRLSAELTLNGGQVLFSPPRASDEPAVDAMSALHPRDGGGNTMNLLVGHPDAHPVILLARFTDVISVANPVHEVDVLAWAVIYNNVSLASHGPDRAPQQFVGYDVTVVDAATGRALREYQSGPPFSARQLGL